MKKIVLTFLAAAFYLAAPAQTEERIQLANPDTGRKIDLMKAFADRKSTREFSSAPLIMQDISDLLWAACGVNREQEKKLTAPTAMNSQEIDLYLCMPHGVYLYSPETHSLLLKSETDLRPHLAVSQEFVLTAPVCLLIVADLSRFKTGDSAQTRMMAACDAGIVSQNISIFCSGAGLATVPRAWMDTDEIGRILNLSEAQVPVLNHPVGYPVPVAEYHPAGFAD